MSLGSVQQLSPRLHSKFQTSENFEEADAAIVHSKLFVSLLDLLVHLLGPDMDSFNDQVWEVGQRHSKYGISSLDVPILGNALLVSLEEVLGDEYFTNQIQESWRDMWRWISLAMIKGARSGSVDGKDHDASKKNNRVQTGTSCTGDWNDTRTEKHSDSNNTLPKERRRREEVPDRQMKKSNSARRLRIRPESKCGTDKVINPKTEKPPRAFSGLTGRCAFRRGRKKSVQDEPTSPTEVSLHMSCSSMYDDSYQLRTPPIAKIRASTHVRKGSSGQSLAPDILVFEPEEDGKLQYHL